MMGFFMSTAARLLLFFLLSISTGAQSISVSPIILPAPTGPYASKLTIHELTDASRTDPFDKSESHRRLLISIFDPVPKKQCSGLCEAQYMPPATAAFQDSLINVTLPLFEQIKLSGLCCGSAIPVYGYMKQQASQHGRYTKTETPLLIFSPGFGTSRLSYSAMAQYVSSYGYTVVTVDHTYDAEIVEFPDGRIARGVFDANATIAEITYALEIRTQDVLFVLDALTKGKHGCPYAYKSSKFGVFGHSLGGVTAAQAMLNDIQHRIVAGVNLDGGFLGPVLEAGLGRGKKAFLLWGSAIHNYTSDQSWDLFWNITDKLNPQYWRKEIHLKDSAHGTFEDFPLLADVSGFRQVNPELVNGALGTINGLRASKIFTTYLVAFFDMMLKGKMEPLLDGPSAKFPEVYFMREGK